MPTPPRILVVLRLTGAAPRGALRGFARAAHDHGWLTEYVDPAYDPEEAIAAARPQAIILLGPTIDTAAPDDPAAEGQNWIAATERRKSQLATLSLTVDLTSRGIHSVLTDDHAIGAEAARHLLSRGLQSFAVYGLAGSDWGLARATAFADAVKAAGHPCPMLGPFKTLDRDEARRVTQSQTLEEFLAPLPKPVGLFVPCDSWAVVASRMLKLAGVAVPEQVALVSADDDDLLCMVSSPPISSVGVPWERLGEEAGALLVRRFAGDPCRDLLDHPIRIAPLGVTVRQSSDVVGATDPELAAALRFIHDNANRVISVDDILQAVTVDRRRLERAFRQHLGSTIMAAVRSAHVDLAKKLLTGTDLKIPEVARRSGFSGGKKLSALFAKATGLPPSEFRRRFRPHG